MTAAEGATTLVRRWFESAGLDDDPERRRSGALACWPEFCDHTGRPPVSS